MCPSVRPPSSGHPPSGLATSTMMENETAPHAQDDSRGASKRGRLMGKLFGRDRKGTNGSAASTNDLDDFLHGSADDRLEVTHGPPPPPPKSLSKLDLSNAPRYPNASTFASTPLEIRPTSLLPIQPIQPATDAKRGLSVRRPPRSSRTRNKRGPLTVSFADSWPDIIGEGGDECEAPSREIGNRRRQARPPLVATATAPSRPADLIDNPRGAPPGAPGNTNGSPPPPLRRTRTGYPDFSTSDRDLVPRPIQRTQTALYHVPDAQETPKLSLPGLPMKDLPAIPAGEGSPAQHLGAHVVPQNDKRKSFIEHQSARQREAEGRVLRSASSGALHDELGPGLDVTSHMFPPSPNASDADLSAGPPPAKPRAPEEHLGSQAAAQQSHLMSPSQLPSPISQPSCSAVSPGLDFALGTQPSQSSQRTCDRRVPAQPRPSLDYSPDRMKRTPERARSPASLYSQSPNQTRNSRRSMEDDSPWSPLRSHFTYLSDSATATTTTTNTPLANDDALILFIARTRHLFELFRLHSESVRPLRSCTPEQLARAALWWFHKGRMALESAIRERPAAPEAQMKNDRLKQQAYTDLAKSHWLSDEIMKEVVGARPGSSPDPEVSYIRQILASNLRKLTDSMKRNSLLPPEEPFLPQTMDRSIWLEYPKVSQDIISLLWGSPSSALAMQSEGPKPCMSMLELIPMGDTSSLFCFGRVPVDVYLLEQGEESQRRLNFPCLLSIARHKKQSDLAFVLASQDGSVQLRVSGVKSQGPTWSDVRWRHDSNYLEVKLPRGFLLGVQCSREGYKMIWSMYDFSSKVFATLRPREDEERVFQTTLRSFQYMDSDPQSRQFPREPVPNCELAVFERLLREGTATGPRTYHRGFRIAVVTGTRTKILSGISQKYTPQAPIQFGLLRNDGNDVAMTLKVDQGRVKGSMMLSFSNEKERTRLQTVLIGASLLSDEEVLADVPVQGIWFSERFGESSSRGLSTLSTLPWRRARVINQDDGDGESSRVLSDRLRIIYEFQDGTVTDRINLGPGEFKLRLDVNNRSCMMLFRQKQTDATIAVTDAKVSREMPSALAQAADMLQRMPTIRTYSFPSLADLHVFETALTGFKVLFDGVASAFAIVRRRMVVPIHKKWEAGLTRIQVVQHEGVSTQLLVFFEDFAHGQCMSFALKGTDVYESFSQKGKPGLKFDDAKFPLPQVLPPDSDGAQAAGDTAFVCLDLPELPGEHDDITILFDTEADRASLISCLPAPVKEARSLKMR